MDISAVIPTKGDVPVGGIVDLLLLHPAVTEVVIESQSGNRVWNRYVGARRARNRVIYTQDDDCQPTLDELIAAYGPGVVTNAMKAEALPNYPGATTLVGWGALFDKQLIKVLDGWEKDELFLRECDRVFTALNGHKSVVVDVVDLPHAKSPGRMYRESRHLNDRQKIEARIRKFLGGQ